MEIEKLLDILDEQAHDYLYNKGRYDIDQKSKDNVIERVIEKMFKLLD